MGSDTEENPELDEKSAKSIGVINDESSIRMSLLITTREDTQKMQAKHLKKHLGDRGFLCLVKICINRTLKSGFK